MTNDNRVRRLTCLMSRRVLANPDAVLVIFSRRLSDTELSFFHEVCQRSAPLMEDETIDRLQSTKSGETA